MTNERRPKADLGHCCESVAEGGFGQFHCTRRASIVEGGKPYCKQHAPSTVQARRDAASVAWNAKREREARESRLREAREAVVKAAMAAYVRMDIDNPCTALHAACRALAEAEKG